jgi:peptidylprolyl isomerase
MVGRVVVGMPILATLSRGDGPLGVYTNRHRWVRVESVQIAADLPAGERTPLEELRTDTPTFTQYVDALRNRRGPWFKVPAGRVSVCAIPLPVRSKSK